MRVLVVEDEPATALMVGEALREAGHEVIGPAATVSGALEAAEAMRPDFALLDVRLASGGSGIDLARVLLRHHGTAALFVTANAPDARRAREAACGCITKPYEADDLVSALRLAERLLHGREPGPLPPGLELFEGSPVVPVP